MARHPQLELRLEERARWGGRRRGAGRKRSPDRRPNVPHRARPQHRRDTPALVTLRSVVRSLRRPEVFRAIRIDLFRARDDSFRVVHFSVQSDHIHLLVEADDRPALARGMHRLVIHIARSVNRALCRTGRVFGDRYHARALETPRAVRIALVYVVRNVEKHLRGVRGVDPCSSGAWVASWPESVIGEAVVDWKPDARTWLLRIGWKRYGPLQDDEIPRHRQPSRCARPLRLEVQDEHVPQISWGLQNARRMGEWLPVTNAFPSSRAGRGNHRVDG